MACAASCPAVVGRFERSGLIVTTGLPSEHWTRAIGGQQLTGALLGRLAQRVHIVEANNEAARFEKPGSGAEERQQPNVKTANDRGGTTTTGR